MITICTLYDIDRFFNYFFMSYVLHMAESYGTIVFGLVFRSSPDVYPSLLGRAENAAVPLFQHDKQGYEGID